MTKTKSSSKAKRHQKRQLPAKYQNATPKAKVFYGFGFTSPALQKCSKRAGGYSVTQKGVDRVAEFSHDFARNVILDATRIAKHCGKKTINEQHVSFAIISARERMGLPVAPVLGIEK